MHVKTIVNHLKHAVEYFITGLGLGMLWLLTRLPYSLQLALGRAGGRLMYRIYPYRKEVGEVNLRICFPEMTADEREALLSAHYESIGMGVMEMGTAWWGPRYNLRNRGTIEGLENLHAARQGGRGVILMTAHFTTLEICGRVLNEQEVFSCLYRKPNNPILSYFMTGARRRLMRKVIHFDDMMGFIRALKEGETIWYAPDQGKSFKYTALLPFFGEPAVTNTATARIAKMTGAAIVPFNGYRKPDGTYHVRILPEMTGIPSGDWNADALALNGQLEDFVRNSPEQYFWLHRRFKGRGADFPDLYAKKASTAASKN